MTKILSAQKGVEIVELEASSFYGLVLI